MRNGRLIGGPFDAREEASEIARRESDADPGATIRVKGHFTEEEKEVTEALCEALDELDKRNRARAETPEYNSYFVRHTQMAVADEDLEELWDQDKIAIHFPGDGNGPDSTSLNPKDYDRRDRRYIRDFATLAMRGGYVWAETRVSPTVKVGRVESGLRVEFFYTTWMGNSDPRYQHKVGSEAVLKTLQLTDVAPVAPREAMSLRAARPQGAVVHWEACGSRLASVVNNEPVERIWSNLSPDIQEAACAEFLRYHQNQKYPKMKFLLMPVGRTLKDVDIYSMDGTGMEIFAQVTFHKKCHPATKRKTERLKQYEGLDSRLLLFCRFLNDSGGEPLGDVVLEPLEEDSVLFVPAEEVLAWIRDNPDYEDKLFTI